MSTLNGNGRMLPSGFGTFTWYSGYTEVHPIEFACDCCAYRRSLFDQITFDEFFIGYGFMEDQEFSYCAGKLGRMVATPHARMLHVESPSARTNYRHLAAMQIRNHHYVFTKHLPKDLYRWACFWWSEFGYSVLRSISAVRALDGGMVVGMFEGYWDILSGKYRRDCARISDTLPKNS